MQLANKIKQDEAEMLQLKGGESRVTPAKRVKESGWPLKAGDEAAHMFTDTSWSPSFLASCLNCIKSC